MNVASKVFAIHRCKTLTTFPAMATSATLATQKLFCLEVVLIFVTISILWNLIQT